MSAGSKITLAGLTPDELAVEMESLNEKRYRSEQVLHWIYEGRADDFTVMTNLPAGLRRALSDRFAVFSAQTEKRLDAFDGTKKYLLRLHDGNAVETVLIPEEARENAPPQNTVCVSTQVGCPIKCRFCASGQGGFVRNLASGEIVEQALRVRNDLPAEQRINRMVVMGIGEPLMNFDNLVEALSRLGEVVEVHPTASPSPQSG
jgi:23S rRNA (adenine2503-C2)-methyltransferase